MTFETLRRRWWWCLRVKRRRQGLANWRFALPHVSAGRLGLLTGNPRSGNRHSLPPVPQTLSRSPAIFVRALNVGPTTPANPARWRLIRPMIARTFRGTSALVSAMATNFGAADKRGHTALRQQEATGAGTTHACKHEWQR